MRSQGVFGVAIAAVVVGVLAHGTSACRALDPSNRPVEACVQACKSKASRQCSAAECERGCEFVLDRLVEKEMNNVIACVARNTRRCTDLVWADCAVHIGVHADGGPPPPPPPAEDD
jgi:hypothetical protein